MLIADDEPAARRGVRQLLAGHPDFVVAGECRDGAEVLTALDRAAPHVVFLDVQMPEVDGFEVIRRRTPEAMPEVVFLTAYDQFAIRAFDAQALDYLVKPVTEARFAATIRRLIRRLGAGLLEDAGAGEAPALAVTAGRTTVLLPIGEIDRIESADNYVRVWAGGKGYLVRRSIRDLEGALAAHGFIRAHRRALIRLDAVRRLVPRADGELVMVLVSGAEIVVSRRRRAAITVAIKGRSS